MGITSDLLVSKSVIDTPFDLIEQAIDTMLEVRSNESITEAVSNQGSDLGLITAGEIVMAYAGDYPGDGLFTGLYLSAAPFEYPAASGNFWNLIGANGDTLEVGISATTGKFLAAGGAVTIGSDAMNVNGLGYAIVHTATDGANTRTLRYGMTELDGLAIPVGQILYTAPAGTNVITSNPGFELGAFTNWTATNAGGAVWAVSSAKAHEGTYSALLPQSGGFGSPKLESDKYTITPSTNYLITGWMFSTASYFGFASGVSIAWYTSGNVLIYEQGLSRFFVQNAWFQMTGSYLSPSNAAKASIVINGYNGTAGVTEYFDEFSISAQTTTSSITFRPNVTIMGPLEMQTQASVPAAPATGYSQLFASTYGLRYINDNVDETYTGLSFNAWGSGTGGTFTFPRGHKMAMIRAVGGGGGGGGGQSGANGLSVSGGGGGGGGGVAWSFFSEGVMIDDPLTITLGLGGTSGTGGTGAVGTAGGNGGDTTVVTASGKTLLFAGGGKGGTSGTGGAGGSAGGLAALAGNGVGATGAGGSSGTSDAFCAEWGGGGGSGSTSGGNSGKGGSSVFGPGGGGGGGGVSSGNVPRNGGDGGTSGVGTPGGGGAGGAGGAPGTAGLGEANGGAYAANEMGAGGGGGGGTTGGAGVNGGDGRGGSGIVGGHYGNGGGGGGGGGGGACHPAASKAGDGGQGGKGSVIIISW